MATGFIDVSSEAVAEVVSRLPANVKILGTAEHFDSICRFQIQVIGSNEPDNQLWTMEVRRDHGPRLTGGPQGGGYFQSETTVFRPIGKRP